MTAQTFPFSKFSSSYLGDASGDPCPVFRDLSPNGVGSAGKRVPWPAEAVFAVYFAAADFPRVARFTPAAPLDAWEFYDETGWPVALSAERRATLGDATKEEFQVCPRDWRVWSVARWNDAREAPELCLTLARQARRHAVLARFASTSTAL